MINKTALLALLMLLPVSAASAAPSSAALTVTARQVLNSRANPLLINITHTFNSTPAAKCTVRLYGKLSTTEGDVAGSTVRLMTKSSASRRVKFSYRGPSARLSAGAQKQLNLQTISTCSGVRIVSTVAAANVTCSKGVTDSSFVKLVRDRVRGVFAHRVSSRSTDSCS